jgi:hypothetical protein
MIAADLKYYQSDVVRFFSLFFILVFVTPMIHYQMHELGLAASLRIYGFKLSISGYFFYLLSAMIWLPYLIFYRILHVSFQRKLSQIYAKQNYFLRLSCDFVISFFVAFAFPIFFVLTESWLSNLLTASELGLAFNGNLIYLFRHPVTLFFYYLVASIYSWQGTSKLQTTN